MRRLLRILLNVATVLSLLLCVITAGLWVRSYRGPITYSTNTSGSPHRIEWHDGLVTLYDVGERPMTAEEYLTYLMLMHSNDRPGEVSIVRPGARPTPPPPPVMRGEREVGSASALWLSAPFIVLPALWLTKASRHRSRLRREIGQCICHSCGYDLRATPDRCPECGQVPAALPPNAPARSPAAPP